MFPRTFAVGLLALACVTAAAGGAYVAMRRTDAPATPAQQAPAATSGPAVQETEAVVTPPAAPATAADLAAAPPLERPARPAAQPSAPAARVQGPVRRPAEPAPSTRTPGGVEGPRTEAAAPAEGVPAPAERDTSRTASRPEPVAAEAAVPPPEPEPPSRPVPVFDELVVPSASVIGLQIETPVSSDRARVEDRIEARVLRDVTVDGQTAVPAGARAIGAVTVVERGGKVKERARLGVRFHTLVLADGTELPMRTETVLREGESPSGESARKIGGAAIGGAILGAIMGGKKGAIIGGATGAAGGSAVVMAGERNAATLPAGAVVTVRLSAPVSVHVERR